MIKEPISLSTDNFYLLANCGLAEVIETSVDDNDKVLNVSLKIPISDIKHMEMNSFEVDHPTSTSVKNILSAFNGLIEKHGKTDANILSVPDFVWNRK